MCSTVSGTLLLAALYRTTCCYMQKYIFSYYILIYFISTKMPINMAIIKSWQLSATMALVLFRYTLWYTINISVSDADLPSTHPTDLTRAKHHASRYYTVSQKNISVTWSNIIIIIIIIIMSIYKAHNVSSRLNLRRRFSISIIFGRNIPKKMWLDETVMLFPICTTWGKF